MKYTIKQCRKIKDAFARILEEGSLTRLGYTNGICWKIKEELYKYEIQPYLMMERLMDDNTCINEEGGLTYERVNFLILFTTIIFYESPHRLADSLKDMSSVLGNRRASLSRELTKKFEETIRGTLEELLSVAHVRQLKGEMVIVVQGAEKGEQEEFDIAAMLLQLLENGYSKKDAIRLVCEKTGVPKNQVYSESLRLKK